MPKNNLKPIRIFYSELSQRFYASRAWRTVKTTNDKEIVEITGQKFDVTDELGALITKHKIEFAPIAKEAS
jgi:hypothetical protein